MQSTVTNKDTGSKTLKNPSASSTFTYPAQAANTRSKEVSRKSRKRSTSSDTEQDLHRVKRAKSEPLDIMPKVPKKRIFRSRTGMKRHQKIMQEIGTVTRLSVKMKNLSVSN